MRDVPAGENWAGFPSAKPVKAFFREVVALERLATGSKKGVPPVADPDKCRVSEVRPANAGTRPARPRKPGP
jgi:hypothetical protein